MLSVGKIDLSPSSSIEYARSSAKYLLLPDLSISSDGAVKSVLLFSRFPIEQLDGECIGFSSESETSIILLRIILEKYFGYSNRFKSLVFDGFPDAFRYCPAVLLIGDTAIMCTRQLPDLYRYDLGELWRIYTGLPFVFALWILREETARNKIHEVALLNKRLHDAKKIAAASFDALAEEYAEVTCLDQSLLKDYWKSISYDLSSRNLAGVKCFFRCAMEIGVLEKEPEIRFFIPPE